jgi:hypothetical protein
MKCLRRSILALAIVTGLLVSPGRLAQVGAQTLTYRRLPAVPVRVLPNYGPSVYLSGLYATQTFTVYSRGDVFLPWRYEGTYRTYGEALQAATYLRLAFGLQVFIR